MRCAISSRSRCWLMRSWARRACAGTFSACSVGLSTRPVTRSPLLNWKRRTAASRSSPNPKPSDCRRDSSPLIISRWRSSGMRSSLSSGRIMRDAGNGRPAAVADDALIALDGRLQRLDHDVAAQRRRIGAQIVDDLGPPARVLVRGAARLALGTAEAGNGLPPAAVGLLRRARPDASRQGQRPRPAVPPDQCPAEAAPHQLLPSVKRCIPYARRANRRRPRRSSAASARRLVDQACLPSRPASIARGKDMAKRRPLTAASPVDERRHCARKSGPSASILRRAGAARCPPRAMPRCPADAPKRRPCHDQRSRPLTASMRAASPP